MSKGINKVILIGKIGQDPEVKTTSVGSTLSTVSLATTEKWKDKTTGDLREFTEWHRVIFWGRQAEVVGQYLKKGSAIYVEGSLRTRKWQDNDGNDRYTTEIHARDMQMLGGQKREPKRSEIDDDIPF